MSDPKDPKDPNYSPSTGGQRAFARMLGGAAATRKPKSAIGYALVGPALVFNAFRGLIGIPPKPRDDK